MGSLFLKNNLILRCRKDNFGFIVPRRSISAEIIKKKASFVDL